MVTPDLSLFLTDGDSGANEVDEDKDGATDIMAFLVQARSLSFIKV